MANQALNYPTKKRDHMKTVDVIFVSDELVGEIVPSRREYERLTRQKLKAENEKTTSEKPEGTVPEKSRKRKNDEDINEVKSKRQKYFDDVELALAALENDGIIQKELLTQPTTLFEEGQDVSANKIYSFQNHAQKTPKSALKSPATPKHQNNVSFSNKENDTPKNKNRLNTIPEEPTTATPYSLRKRVIKDIKKIQKILENSDDDFSPSESEYSGESSEESESETDKENETEIESGKDTSETKSEKVIKKPVRRKLLNYKTSVDNFFESQSTKKSITSSNTLKKLKTPRLTQEKLDEVFENFEISVEHKDSIKNLLDESLSNFEKWDFILKQNYNLLLYGVGSKKEIVNKFIERFHNKQPVIVVNGFFPSITIKEVLDKVCHVLKINSDAADLIRKIQNKISKYDLKIYLVINNIDGIMLRNKKSQITLSQLAKIEQIHLIATIDHINAPLIWDKGVYSDFNWIWYDATTFLNYKDEIIYEGNLMLQNSGQLTLSSLRSVFNSLTKNSRGIFLVILKNQLQSENKKTGITFRELYQECRKELLISSDVALRSQLKEFLDHMILKQKRTTEGEEYFVISIDHSILKQFLEEQEKC